jgi:hypothetical protein
VDARANSTFGITSVSATFDGKPIGSLTQPNACSRFCGSSNDIYRFTVNAVAVGSGTYTMEITATDGAGSSRSVTVSIPVNNAPTLSLTEPLDGAQVFGTLRVTGTSTSDKTGAVTTTARLGDVEFLNTQSSPFGGTFNLAGVTPGTYTLTVRSTDSTGQATQVQRSVVVTSSATLAYTPALELPTGGQLLAVESSKVLYSSGDGGYAVRDLASNSETRLTGVSTLQYATDWQLSGDRVYAQAKDSDCTPTFNCVYEWNAAGVRRNLSLLSPFTSGSSYQANPVASDGYVVWTNWNGPNPGSYTVFNVATDAFTKVNQPSGVNYIGNTDYGISVIAGVVNFAFWGQTGGDGNSSQFDVFLWKSDTNTSTRLTSGGARHIYPKVDRSRLAWQQSPLGGSADNTFELQVRELSGSTTSSASTTATQFQLRDGVLAWLETPTTGSRALKVLTESASQTLSALTTTTLLDNAEGWVVYSQGSKTYTWNSSTGLSTLRLDTTPSRAFISAGTLVFTVGQSVYRIALD